MTRIGLACFVCGIILLYRQSVLPPPGLLVLMTGLAFLPALILRVGVVRLVWLAPGLFLAGLAWAGWHAEARIEARLPGMLEGKSLEVSGYVCGVPEPGSFDSVRFPFCVTRWHGEAFEQLQEFPRERLPQRLRLAWYGDDASLRPPPQLRLEVVLKKPHGAVNPRGFRYESWLFRQNFGATGSIRGAGEDRSVPCRLECRYHQWRGAMVEKLGERLQSAESAPLISSLMLGYRGQLEPGHWQVLKATGTIHLVAISGLHLGLVAIGAGFLFRRLLVLLPERWLPPARSRLVLFSLVCLASLGYALAAGFSVPTRRALIMVVVACWWVLNARRGQAMDMVLVALFLVLVSDPLAPLDQGFWLSFGAVGILTLVFGGLLRPMVWWRSLLIAQIAIFAVLWPILVALDQSQPLAGFFANLVAIPLVSVLVMPAVFLCALSLLIVPWLDWIFIGVLDYLLLGLWWFLETVAGLTLPSVNPGMAELMFGALLVVMALAIPLLAFRLILTLTMTLWFTVAGGLWDPGQGAENARVPWPEVWIWDVGQGLSILVRQADRVLLYDTGPELEGVYSAAESVLVPNLKALGIARIDTLVISHGDNDHSGGVPLLLKNFAVGQLLTGEPGRLAARLGPHADVAIGSCAGAVETRNPGFVSWQSGGRPEGNDASCVLTFVFNEGRQELILSGDITAGAEQAFLAENHESLAADDRFRVILAPHHGSKTSSTPAWVSGLAPDLVLFSAGYRHRYRHPHSDVVKRYEAAGSRLFNTATSGALHLVFASAGVGITETRSGAPFWVGRGAGPRAMSEWHSHSANLRLWRQPGAMLK